jgi:hypothetical protein
LKHNRSLSLSNKMAQGRCNRLEVLEAVLHEVIKAPSGMEVLPFLTGGFQGYFFTNLTQGQKERSTMPSLLKAQFRKSHKCASH